MKKITIRKEEMVTDIRYYAVEISSEDFPEILADDFDINNCSDELDEALDESDWDLVAERVGDPNTTFSIKE